MLHSYASDSTGNCTTQGASVSKTGEQENSYRKLSTAYHLLARAVQRT